MRVALSTTGGIYPIFAQYEFEVAVGPFILSSYPACIYMLSRSDFFILVGPLLQILIRYW